MINATVTLENPYSFMKDVPFLTYVAAVLCSNISETDSEGSSFIKWKSCKIKLGGGFVLIILQQDLMGIDILLKSLGPFWVNLGRIECKIL